MTELCTCANSTPMLSGLDYPICANCLKPVPWKPPKNPWWNDGDKVAALATTILILTVLIVVCIVVVGVAVKLMF